MAEVAEIHGTDLSHWNGLIDYVKFVVAGIWFMFAKIGEIPLSSKKEYADDCYQRNIREAKAHGIYDGAYYFFHPSIGASRQARHFVKLMNLYGWPTLPPVIDVEVTDGMKPIDCQNVLKSMIDYMAELGIYEVIIYTRNGLWVNQYGNPDWGKGYEYTDSERAKHQIKIWFWMAQYPKLTNKEPKIRDQFILHQWTDKGRIPGIGVNLDRDNWLKTEADFLKLAGKDEQERPYESTPEYMRGKRQEEALLQQEYHVSRTTRLALALHAEHGRSEDDKWRFIRNAKGWG